MTEGVERPVGWKVWVGLEGAQEREKAWVKFKGARREVRRAVGIAKQEAWKTLGEEVEESFVENKKMFWARVKALNG